MADKKLFVLATILVTLGIFFSYTLSTYTVVHFEYSDYHFVVRQILFGITGIILMWAISQLDPDIWLHRFGMTLFIGGMLLMLVMPFLPEHMARAVGGAKRWIKFFGFSLAPVEFFKIGFVYFLAWSFSRKLGHHAGIGVLEEIKRFSPYAVVFVIVMFLIAFMQNDLGQVVVLGLTLLFFLFLIGSSFKFFLVLMSSALTFLLFFIFTAEHRILRIKSWWALAQNFILDVFPESIAKYLRVDVNEEPYQISHSLNAIHNGGLFGVGMGDGTFKLGFLSEVHTDFVLAGIAEEFGFVGVLYVCFMFLWLLKRIFMIANRAECDVVYLFSVGIGLLLAFAFLINAFGVSGLTPIKGISVPFLSYGGSATLGACIAVGMVLMASKKAKI